MMAWARLLGVLCVSGSVSGCVLAADDDAEQAGEQLEEASEELKRRALSKQQEALVLKLIDDTCGDTWCEGDHNFSFDALRCQQSCAGQDGTCELTLRLFSHDTDLATGPSYRRTCTTTGFTGFHSLVTNRGDHQSLEAAYYEALTQCISRLEDTVPH